MIDYNSLRRISVSLLVFATNPDLEQGPTSKRRAIAEAQLIAALDCAGAAINRPPAPVRHVLGDALAAAGERPPLGALHTPGTPTRSDWLTIAAEDLAARLSFAAGLNA
jgi:hypothetical protein